MRVSHFLENVKGYTNSKTNFVIVLDEQDENVGDENGRQSCGFALSQAGEHRSECRTGVDTSEQSSESSIALQAALTLFTVEEEECPSTSADTPAETMEKIVPPPSYEDDFPSPSNGSDDEYPPSYRDSEMMPTHRPPPYPTPTPHPNTPPPKPPMVHIVVGSPGMGAAVPSFSVDWLTNPLRSLWQSGKLRESTESSHSFTWARSAI